MQNRSVVMFRMDIPVLRIAVLVAMVGFSSTTHVSAQTKKGSVEIGFEGGPVLFIATGGHEAVGGFLLAGEPHVSYFLADELAVGATGFLYHSLDHDASQAALFFGGAYAHVNYHFNPGGTVSPFIGGRIGVFNPNSESQLALGAQGGLQFFPADQLSVNVQLEAVASPGSAGNVLLACVGLGLSYHIR